MHALVVHTTISDLGADESLLHQEVVPRVSLAPGFVAGYWTRKDDSGLSVTIWESEDAADRARDVVRAVTPDDATLEGIEVREVIASA
jgi:heme-degrading monooxygenase HmoA